ncbi:MAG: hypothetical protein SCM11_18850, partial [Bacillota bacterium]|nr:hypothetical protein [Bacillota bacterium]
MNSSRNNSNKTSAKSSDKNSGKGGRTYSNKSNRKYSGQDNRDKSGKGGRKLTGQNSRKASLPGQNAPRTSGRATAQRIPATRQKSDIPPQELQQLPAHLPVDQTGLPGSPD